MEVRIANKKGEVLDIMIGDDDSEEMHNLVVEAVLNALSTRTDAPNKTKEDK